jgi:glycosyltransferase involved in cell wall biosynthesis
MFQALRRLATEWPRVGLAVFGPGTEDEAFWREAREEGVEDRVEACGEMAHSQVLGLMACCDVFVRPTTYDGDALSVREALMLGVPCVASDVCVRPEGTRLFRTGDVEALVARVREAVAGGRVRVAQPDMGPVLLGLYRELQVSEDSYDPGVRGLVRP